MAQRRILSTNNNMCTQKVSTMPLTQEKHLENSFTNNNDQSYLHKKFKKKASTITPSLEIYTDVESRQLVVDETLAADNFFKRTSLEVEKTNEVQDGQNIFRGDNNVQTIFSIESDRLSNVNKNSELTGQTSFTDEFSNKTENLENHFSKETQNGGLGGRYICPYCKLSCAKPSVLQKHIRAHTNERPYPCVPCGFAFKTKSNLYKHRRSRTHALRLQGGDVTTSINEDDWSGGSESDTSQPQTSISDAGSEVSVFRSENFRSNEFSSPELVSDRITPPTTSLSVDSKSRTLYKPKFRAAFYQESDKEKAKKNMSPNADFLTEHISKIISDNEAIVDVIEIPLQKMYGKLKPDRQFLYDNTEIKAESTPLNLTVGSIESENTFRKRSHSESFSQTDQKHPLNPEGSIIKDLLLKTKANGVLASNGDLEGPLYICPVCPISYRSADNLEIHRMYYCKGNLSNNSVINASQKEVKSSRPDNIFVRSNSINVRFPETQPTFIKVNVHNKSPTERSKPENLIITKPDSNDVIAPLPSPGPLLGNTRLVDTRISSEFAKISKTDGFKIKNISSPKRRLDCRSESYSPRLSENSSPRSNSDLYSQSKIRCIETSSATHRSLDEMSQQMRHNSTSLQMFGGEVKIVDHLGSTTTLRIEPSKNQLSPILIHQNLSPSKIVSDAEASNVVVRSGLHSGGIIVHNPPTPKEMVGIPQPQTPRITLSTKPGLPSTNVASLHDLNHFQFPPLSAITAFNPLTLPPLSPTSPNGATTIFHGGKLIPHVPGIPGPNSSNIFIASQVHTKPISNNSRKVNLETYQERTYNKSPPINNIQVIKGAIVPKQDSIRNSRSPNNIKSSQIDPSKSGVPNTDTKQFPTIPTIRVKNVDETHTKSLPSNLTKFQSRQEGTLKRNSDGLPIAPILRESIKVKNSEKHLISTASKVNDNKSDTEIRNFNFENLITKAEIYNNQMPSSSEVQKNTNAQETPATSNHNERSETSYFQKNTTTKSGSDDRKPKFLRPSTLPLKPGTFTPKRHHGITPNANTLPLVSPETPRPAKAYGQLYLNGNAYTYLGLKCSTKVFYCTINRLQPTYVPNQHFLSMYSNWQLLSELTPDPLGLSASSAMSLYDSRHRPQNVAVSVIKQDLILTHSSQWNRSLKENKQSLLSIDARRIDDKLQLSDNTLTPKKELAGGFESNEEYTYVRGRGRGRYVCSECGIRCKKPSMLKKHIRTHTDVRPYTCKHCAFSFKTKGNLTKHMKSKAHYKKCCELGINPNEGNEIEGGEMTQCSGETDEDTDTDGDEGNEGETESSDTEVGKSRLPEHEAARCLLSLGGSRPATSATPGLITSARPTTYPYAPTGVEITTSDIKVVQLDNLSVDSRDTDNEPMDLSKSDVKATSNIPEIPTARESSVLASLASNTAKLPQHENQWSNGEPMLHTYLTERALLDSKIKQSQLTTNSVKLRKMEMEKNIFSENLNKNDCTVTTNSISKAVIVSSMQNFETCSKLIITSEGELSRSSPAGLSNNSHKTNEITESEIKRPQSLNSNPEFVFTDLIVKHSRINHMNAFDVAKQLENATNNINNSNSNLEEKTKIDEIQISDTEVIKLPPIDHDPVARKVVVGAGGVAYKVTKGKDFDGPSYSQGRLMEDGRRVCDFCNKSFTKPSQLRLHLNIHYMERPFRCSACAVSFRTRGHLQKHERSGSHHNKVSMTSTFGAATSLNPRPFRCSDCNIAFRIHGHLAKHLRSKMHVMRLECLFKLPFGTFTEIERAGVSLTDIDTTDCASSLASLQCLARKLHEKDPTKLEYRDPNEAPPAAVSTGRESSEEEDSTMSIEKTFIDSERDSELKNSDLSESQDIKHKSVM